MVDRITRSKGPSPTPEERKPQISGELKKVLADTIAAVKNVRLAQFDSKLTGYALGASNKRAAEKEEKVASKNMLKWQKKDLP